MVPYTEAASQPMINTQANGLHLPSFQRPSGKRKGQFLAKEENSGISFYPPGRVEHMCAVKKRLGFFQQLQALEKWDLTLFKSEKEEQVSSCPAGITSTVRFMKPLLLHIVSGRGCEVR